MPISEYCGPRPLRGPPEGADGVSDARTHYPGTQCVSACNGYGRYVQLPVRATIGLSGEQQAHDTLIAVLEGAVKGYMELASGQRLIVGFRFAGDALLVPAGEGKPLLIVEALTPAKLQYFSDGELSRLREEQPQLDRKLWHLSYRELSGINRHLLRLACMDAKARVASFLLEMQECLTGPKGDRRVLWLPMPRQDIAEYLGLKPETISRHFTRLRMAKIIDTPSPKQVIVRDRRRLSALAGMGDGLEPGTLD